MAVLATKIVASQEQKDLGFEGLKTWNTILTQHSKLRESQIDEMFIKGLQLLNITADKIPSIIEINKKLREFTGFEGVFVDGLEDGNSFYQMLAHRQFPVGNFIRDKKDLNYTPAPDIVHDLYGHLPFFADLEYANFCQKFGEMACEFMNEPKLLKQFESFFWFTIEFGLIKTANGNRVFGAGIASSIGECTYALSDAPEVNDFDIDKIRYQEFRIDEMQKRLFILESKQQLYDSLEELYRRVKLDRNQGENND